MDAVITFFAEMPFWYWWVLALILLVIELLTGSTYFLWPAIAAAAAGLFSLGPMSDAWQLQLLLFATLTIALSIFAPPYVKPWLYNTQADHLTLNERGAQKIGRRAKVEAAFDNGVGKIRLGDTLWLAESETGEDFMEGVVVEITRADGTKLFVKSVA